MAEAFTNSTQILEPFRGVKKVTLEEYFTSGHRTCQGCESALVMKLMVKAAGPRTIVLGATSLFGCLQTVATQNVDGGTDGGIGHPGPDGGSSDAGADGGADAGNG